MGPLSTPISASFPLQTAGAARLFSPAGSPAPDPARTCPLGASASQPRQAASPAAGVPPASCPRTASAWPPPSADASTSPEPWVSAALALAHPPTGPCPAPARPLMGQPRLQDGGGPPGGSNTAGLSPPTPHPHPGSPGLVQVRASIRMSRTQGPMGRRLMEREVGGGWVGEGIGGHAELSGVPPPFLCPQGSLRTGAGQQGLLSALGRAWTPERWWLGLATTGEP